MFQRIQICVQLVFFTVSVVVIVVVVSGGRCSSARFRIISILGLFFKVIGWGCSFFLLFDCCQFFVFSLSLWVGGYIGIWFLCRRGENGGRGWVCVFFFYYIFRGLFVSLFIGLGFWVSRVYFLDNSIRGIQWVQQRVEGFLFFVVFFRFQVWVCFFSIFFFIEVSQRFG